MGSQTEQPGLSALRDAFFDAPIGIILVDAEHRLVEANPRFMNLLGYTREELVAMGPLFCLTHPEDASKNKDLILQLHAGSIKGFTVEKRYVAKDGRDVWVQVHTSLVRRQPAAELTLGLVVDITDRKRAEERARLEAARARNVIEATSDGVYTLNQRWEVTYVNQSAIRAAGFDPSGLGQNFWELYPAANTTRLGPALRRAMEQRVPVEFEDFYPEPHNLHYTASIYPTEEGVTVFYRDITQKRRAELALREAEKMAAVGRLAASIAHEINNPLEAMTNLLYLARNCQLSDEVANYLRVAERELARVSHVTTSTLSFHRQLTAASWVSPHRLFQEVLELYRSRLENCRIQSVVGPVTGTVVQCLEGEIRQVLANLVANAIDATRTGGMLYLRAHDATGRNGRPGVRLVVADTGQGIPPHLQARVFEAFFTTKELGGTGLGLWLSRSIVENHRGSISVRSRLGHGTVFSIFLPCEAIAHERSNPAPE